MKRPPAIRSTMKLFLLMTAAFVLLQSLLWVVSDPATPSVVRSWSRSDDVNVTSLLDDDVTVDESFIGSEDSIRRFDSFAGSFRSVHSRTGISCTDLFEGRQEDLETSRDYMKRSSPPPLDSEFYRKLTGNCSEFVAKRGYATTPASREEAEFPIAFSILIYTDFQMAERLLRAIYAPQNFYCIHVDADAEEEVKEVLGRVSGCLPNVFLAERSISVHWGHVSIVEADSICMEQLLRYKWKYFVNLSGRMFPLRTNSELVRILKLFGGANDVDGSKNRAKHPLLSLRQMVEWRHSKLLGSNVFSFRPKRPPPHHVTIFTGSNQAVLSRAFVVYFLYSEVSRDIFEWFSNTLVPDEYVWPTLNHNPHLKVPGGFTGDAENKPTIARLSLWKSPGSQWKCQGFWERELCIFGVGDLQWLIRQPHLFVNKFHGTFEQMAVDCMEELIFNRTVSGMQENFKTRSKTLRVSPDVPLNLSFYRSLPFISDPSKVTQLRDSALRGFA